MTYNGIGQVTGDTLGNGVTETFGYDANRMQLTSQTAGTASPYTNRMNLAYSYQASAGQMGAGSTAGNAGQLMTVSGTINGTTESAAYTYDDLGRLVTSNQTSNGSSAQRRFAYDRWGNRTGMWDATSGGNQIQSITLQQSGGAPTNQIASVTTTGTVSYSYDAAGNVTNDGVHTYVYDSENHLVSVDGGVTGSYAYDNQNRRYKKAVGSTITHYVWEGSQVLAEHNGSTGAVITDFVIYGGKMIAKIASGSTSYFLSDRLSTRLTMDTSGNVLGRQAHLPFGEDFAESGVSDKHHLTAYERDGESGIDYAINRYYGSNTGRFFSCDPYRASEYLQDPRSWNRYVYTRNVLTNRIDPSGLDDQPAGPKDEPLHQNPDGSISGRATAPTPGGSGSGGSSGGGPSDGMTGLGGIFDGIGRAKGPPLIDGNGAGPSAKSVLEMIEDALRDVQQILSTDNACSQYLGGTANAEEALTALGANLRPGNIQDTSVSIQQSGQQTIITNQAGFTYRTFANAIVNTRGPFAMALNTANGHVGERLPNVGSFAPASRGAEALGILHELAHLIRGQDGNWLIPDDGDNPTQSSKNTTTVESKCGDQIRALH